MWMSGPGGGGGYWYPRWFREPGTFANRPVWWAATVLPCERRGEPDSTSQREQGVLDVVRVGR